MGLLGKVWVTVFFRVIFHYWNRTKENNLIFGDRS